MNGAEARRDTDVSSARSTAAKAGAECTARSTLTLAYDRLLPGRKDVPEREFLSMAGGAYDPGTWHDFFVAAAGAAAALSGLIFVAVSINLRAILAEEKKIGSSYLTGRALESLAALLIVLGISLVGLDPSIGRVAFAAVLLVSAAGSAVSPVRATLAYRSSRVKPVAYSLRRFIALILVAAYAISGFTLLAQGGGGLHWLPFAFLLAVTIAASNAWVLLVEVLR